MNYSNIRILKREIESLTLYRVEVRAPLKEVNKSEKIWQFKTKWVSYNEAFKTVLELTEEDSNLQVLNVAQFLEAS